MRVYRYVSENELEKILSNDIDNIGNMFERHKKDVINNHKYIKGVKYLHFFKDKKDLERMQLVYRKHIRPFYFCEFEIPTKALLSHSGQGYYPAMHEETDYAIIDEFALPVKLFKKDYLKAYEVESEFCPRKLITVSDEREL